MPEFLLIVPVLNSAVVHARVHVNKSLLKGRVCLRSPFLDCTATHFCFTSVVVSAHMCAALQVHVTRGLDSVKLLMHSYGDAHRGVVQ
jgi:hypothetical protein